VVGSGVLVVRVVPMREDSKQDENGNECTEKGKCEHDYQFHVRVCHTTPPSVVSGGTAG
jgi:hypothetical protein